MKAIVRTSSHGLGLFATASIAAGETIVVVPAEKYARISYKELLRKRVTDNPLQVSPRRYLDWQGPAVRANHSCDPNCGLTAYPDLRLIALRAIRAGEELRWDYSTSIDADTECSFTCHCEAPSCRRVIGGFAKLPKPLQTRYKRFGVVQTFLQREHSATKNILK